MIEFLKIKTRHIFALAVCYCVFSASLFVYLLQQSTIIEQNQLPYQSSQIITLINNVRIKNNLKPLIIDPELLKASEEKVNDMVKKSYFSHVSPKENKRWSSFILENNYTYKEAGENLANGYKTPEEIVQAWLDSPSHRENIFTKEYQDTSVSLQRGFLNGKSTIFVVQLFGNRPNQGMIGQI